MANPELLTILKQGVEAWNQWRKDNPRTRPNLSRADLRKADLNEVDLSGADLFRADLSRTHFRKAILVDAYLHKADFSRANLSAADLRRADLRRAIINGVDLSAADLFGANLDEADLSGARMSWTTLGHVDLSQVKGVESVRHDGPSTIGIDTIYKSAGSIPEEFFRGAGIPDEFIAYTKSLVGKSIDFYSAFISYSHKEKDFAYRLHNSLQRNNIRTWYAPEDLKIGDKFRQRIDESIRLHDKLLIILSEESVTSGWVDFEVEAALDRGGDVLFPVRINNAVLDSEKAWAKHIKRTLHIGDFSKWKEHDAYQEAFERLPRDLKSAVEGGE